MISRTRLIALTTLAMFAFAGNSLLCRVALRAGSIDAASFATVRIVSGALMLWLIVLLRSTRGRLAGNWLSAVALFVYAVAFSFSYLSLTAATGAILLFGAVQATMIGHGLWSGERLRPRALAGLALSLGGLVVLLLPGISAPPMAGSIAMVGAGLAWGAYSLRGRGVDDPSSVTAGNFLRAVPFAAIVSVAMLPRAHLEAAGVAYAIASGALTSGLGYAIWYAAVRDLSATGAAVVQLSVPAIAALGGILLLGEPITLRFLIASGAILAGIALVTL